MSERTLAQAIRNAERLRAELPHLIQPTNSDRDMVRLADELYRQRAEVERLRLALSQIHLQACDIGLPPSVALAAIFGITEQLVPSPGDGK